MRNFGLKELTVAAMATTLVAVSAHAAGVNISATSFKIRRNGVTVVCGLVDGKFVPGTGKPPTFVSTKVALKKLSGKKDAKSKAKVKKLKAYLKLGSPICKRYRFTPPTPVPATPKPDVGGVTPTPSPTPVPPVQTAIPTPNGSGNAAVGEQVYNDKCGACHSASRFQGWSASRLKSISGMPSLTDQEAADVAAFLR